MVVVVVVVVVNINYLVLAFIALHGYGSRQEVSSIANT